MIWIALIVMSILVLVFMFSPLFGTLRKDEVSDASVYEYADRISELERRIATGGDDIAELAEAKTALQRKVLAEQDGRAELTSISAKTLVISIATFFCAATMLLYSQLGSPKFAVEQSNAIDNLEGLSLEQLVARLEDSLKADPANPNGWIYYARSLMTLGRHDEALAAYDRALVITNSDEKIVSERASAVRYLDQVNNQTNPEPTSEDVDAAMAMTPEARQAMIQNMVDGLSDRLKDNPLDEDGWIRLLKARGVLDQSEELASEIVRMRSAFADQPETIERILSAVGLNDPQ